MKALRRWVDFLGTPKAMQYGRSIGMVLVVLAVASNGFALRYAIHADKEQREGRQLAVQTTCAAIGAVIDAGRATIIAGGLVPRKLERHLMQYGYPSAVERRKAAQIAAASYARMIASRVEQITGRDDLVSSDGSLDCTRLRAVTQP